MRTSLETILSENPHTIAGEYWDNRGEFQEQADRYWMLFVPQRGAAATPFAEALRSIARLNYDYYNNGNCNVLQTNYVCCPDCSGEGHTGDHITECSTCCGNCDISLATDFNPYYDDMLKAIGKYLGHRYEQALREFCLSPYGDGYHDHQSRKIYDIVTNEIVKKFEQSLITSVWN